jgi:hypothetical protein
MYRVYDNKDKGWVQDCIYPSPNDDLSMEKTKKSLFSKTKLTLVSEQRYICQRDIGLTDKKEKLIFEGDICSTKSGDIMGVIAYIPEHASYYLLDDRTMKYYPLGKERCKQLEVIGNVFEREGLISMIESGGDENADS